VFAQILGEGRPLIAIHGFGVDHRILLPLEDMVGDAGWRRCYIDLPWAAAAAPSRAASSEDIAVELVEAIVDLVGAEPFAIIGNSYGGMLARHVAHELRSQVLGLATLAGVFEPDQRKRILPAKQVVQSDSGVTAAAGPARDDYEEMTVIQSTDTLDMFVRHVLPGVRGADAALLARIEASYTLTVEPEAAHPDPFAAPSLHLFGRQDHVTGFEDGWALRDHYVRGTFAVLDAAGHNAHLERPSLVAALVRDWLDRIATS
jgi:pimeloyl-ACP methyl ester carboxylesterase